MHALLDDVAARFQRVRDSRGEIDRLFTKLDLSAGDPRDIEQIFEQPRQVPHLAIDNLPGLLHMGIAGFAHADDLRRDSDRREGVAQLVSQHRQKLVLRLHRRGEPRRRLFVLLGSDILAQQRLGEGNE